MSNYHAEQLRRLDAAYEALNREIGALQADILRDAKRPDPLAQLHAEFAEAERDRASSNNIVQLLDDFLVKHGRSSVLYA